MCIYMCVYIYIYIYTLQGASQNWLGGGRTPRLQYTTDIYTYPPINTYNI